MIDSQRKEICRKQLLRKHVENVSYKWYYVDREYHL